VRHHGLAELRPVLVGHLGTDVKAPHGYVSSRKDDCESSRNSTR
jgi:hypothetical protein